MNEVLKKIDDFKKTNAKTEQDKKILDQLIAYLSLTKVELASELGTSDW